VKRWAWPLVIVVAIVALVVSLAVTYFIRGTGDTVSAPDGLTAREESGVVQLSWTADSTAAGYLLSRGDNVVYSGPDTEFADISAVAPSGTDTVAYSVRAVDAKGRVSKPSDSESITVGPGWGLFAPSAHELPELLPATPTEQGWNDMRCESRMDAIPPEEGADRDGSGEQFIRAGFRCVVEVSGREYDLWTDFYVSPEALNTRMDEIRGWEGVSSTTWERGRAVTGGGGEDVRWMGMEVDSRPDVYIELSAADKSTTLDQLADVANSLPVN
jgi:hypothetical protein